MDQFNLFDEPILDAAAGELLKQEAIDRVRENADDDWKSEAFCAVFEIAGVKSEFTTDDVWVALGGRCGTHDPRAMGAVMTDAASAGICVKSSRVTPSKRKQCHKRPISIWISCRARSDDPERGESQ